MSARTRNGDDSLVPTRRRLVSVALKTRGTIDMISGSNTTDQGGTAAEVSEPAVRFVARYAGD